MSVYDLTQTVFLFSMVSNYASSQKGTRQELAQYLALAADKGGTWQPGGAAEPITVNGFLAHTGNQLIGQDWSMVWGPGICERTMVWKPGTLPRRTKTAQNAMLVFHSPSLNTYVVAIAGTNPHSAYDWIVEDGMVGGDRMAHFPVHTGPLGPQAITADPALPQVSLGTATGINNLIEHMYGVDGKKVSLAKFLEGLKGSPGARVIFTGHSLGGALSSTMAAQSMIYLRKNWVEQGGQVLVLPTAGPSPGNGTFATYWGKLFQPVHVDTNPHNKVHHLNVLCWDAQDVVPHAWDYILSPEPVSPPAYPNDKTPYFAYDISGLLKLEIQTQLGQLKNMPKPIPPSEGKSKVKLPWVAGLAAALKMAQEMGRAGNMCRLPHSKGHVGTSPMTVWDSQTNAWGSYALPANNQFGSFKEFGIALGNIHVWQYHQFFGIDPKAIVRPIA